MLKPIYIIIIALNYNKQVHNKYSSYELLGDSNSRNIPFPLVVDMFNGCNK